MLLRNTYATDSAVSPHAADKEQKRRKSPAETKKNMASELKKFILLNPEASTRMSDGRINNK